MIVDNDTGKIFDTRIDKHVERATMHPRSTMHPKSSGPLDEPPKKNKGSEEKKKELKKSMRASAWGDWWDEKK